MTQGGVRGRVQEGVREPACQGFRRHEIRQVTGRDECCLFRIKEFGQCLLDPGIQGVIACGHAGGGNAQPKFSKTGAQGPGNCRMRGDAIVIAACEKCQATPPKQHRCGVDLPQFFRLFHPRHLEQNDSRAAMKSCACQAAAPTGGAGVSA
jgi:hypothetical protein